MMKKSWAHIMNSAAMELSLHESVQSIVSLYIPEIQPLRSELACMSFFDPF